MVGIGTSRSCHHASTDVVALVRNPRSATCTYKVGIHRCNVLGKNVFKQRVRRKANSKGWFFTAMAGAMGTEFLQPGATRKSSSSKTTGIWLSKGGCNMVKEGGTLCFPLDERQASLSPRVRMKPARAKVKNFPEYWPFSST